MAEIIETSSANPITLVTSDARVETSVANPITLVTSDARIETSSANLIAAITSDARIQTSVVSPTALVVAEEGEPPDGGGGAIEATQISAPFSFSLVGVKIDKNRAVVSIESDGVFLYSGDALKSSVSFPYAINSGSHVKFIFYKNYAAVYLDGCDIGTLWFVTGEYSPSTFGIDEVYEGSGEIEIVEAPDLTMGIFIETGNSPMAAASQLIGDRPIIVSKEDDGSISLFTKGRADAQVLPIEDAYTATRTTHGQRPARIAVLSYSVFVSRMDSPTIFSTVVVRMNADALPVRYASILAKRKFGEIWEVSTRENTTARLGDTLTMTAVAQNDGKSITIGGEIISKSVTDGVAHYVAVN